MAKAKKETAKKETADKNYKITTDTGQIIFRKNLGDYIKVYEAKGHRYRRLGDQHSYGYEPLDAFHL